MGIDKMELLLPRIKPTYISGMYNFGLVVVYKYPPDSALKKGGGSDYLKKNQLSRLESTVKSEQTEPDSVEADIQEALTHSIRRGSDEF